MLASCGSDHVLDEQNHQRDRLAPEIAGIWSSNCQSNQIIRLNLESDKLTVTRQDYFDPECQELRQTTRTTGGYQLSNNFKTGINNTIVFSAPQEVRVTLNTENEVDTQNNVLTAIQNEKEAEIAATLPAITKKQIARENLRIRKTKELNNWKKDEEKTLTRLQAEKLASKGLDVRPAAEFGSNTSVRYEVDNGFLQLSGGQDFARVFSRK